MHRNLLLKHVIEGKIEDKKEDISMDDLKEERRYWNLKEEALHHNLWRACSGRGAGPVARWTMP